MNHVRVFKMSGLERIRPFFRLCQCVGFIPFRMETDNLTGRFQRFTFSWRYSIVWWFVMISFIQFVCYYFIVRSFFNNSELKEMPVTVYVPLTASTNIYFLTVVSARFWITIRFSALCKAIELMRRLELSLKDNPDCKCTINRRLTVGLIVTVVWVRFY